MLCLPGCPLRPSSHRIPCSFPFQVPKGGGSGSSWKTQDRRNSWTRELFSAIRQASCRSREAQVPSLEANAARSVTKEESKDTRVLLPNGQAEPAPQSLSCLTGTPMPAAARCSLDKTQAQYHGCTDPQTGPPIPPHRPGWHLSTLLSQGGQVHPTSTPLHMRFFLPGTLLHLLLTWITPAQTSMLRRHLLREGCLDAPRPGGASYGLPQWPAPSPVAALTNRLVTQLSLHFPETRAGVRLQPRAEVRARERWEQAGSTLLLCVCCN